MSDRRNNGQLCSSGCFRRAPAICVFIDHAGREVPVPLNDDHAYWITITEPTDMLWTTSAGTTRQTPFGRYGMHRTILGG